MKSVLVQVRIPLSVAIRAGSPAYGETSVTLGAEELAALSDEERAELAILLDPSGSIGSRLYYSAPADTVGGRGPLVLPTPDTSPGAILAALRGHLAACIARSAEARAARATVIAEVTTGLCGLDPHDVLDESGAPKHGPAGVLASKIAAGYGATALQNLLVPPDPAEWPASLTVWLDTVRAIQATRREAWAAGAGERHIAAVCAIPPTAYVRDGTVTMAGSTSAQCDALRAIGIDPGHLETATHADPRVAAWLDALRAQPERQRAVAEAKREAEARAWAPLLIWASANSSEIRDGIEAGYDQRGLARGLVESVLCTGLCVSAAMEAEIVGSDPALPVRTGVRAPALAGLATVRENAERLSPELPEGVALVVGRLSRQEVVRHTDECNDASDDECTGGDACKAKRTVVPVRVTGLPFSCWVIVPTE